MERERENGRIILMINIFVLFAENKNFFPKLV